MSTYLSTQPNNSIHFIDIVYGGDHGQGQFRSMIKVIFRDIDGNNIYSIVLKVAHIDCKVA